MDYIREKTDSVAIWGPASNETVAQSSFNPDIVTKQERMGKTTTYTYTLKIGKKELSQIYKVEDDIMTSWQVKHWCEDLSDVDAFLSTPYTPISYDFSDFKRINSEVGDNGIIMTSFADPMFLAADLMSFEDFTIWAMTESEHFRKTVNIFHERNMQNIKQMLDTQTVDLYRICGPEYCTPPFLPPHMFDEYVLPYVKDMCDLIHSYGKKVRFHSHGKISKVLDSILKTGADAIDPVEDLPDGDISLKDVKQKLKDKMCIFGNIQLKMLENSSEKEVRDYVNYCMDSAKEGYGYVIMPTASPINIPLSTKTQDNYFAFIDQALKAGIY